MFRKGYFNASLFLYYFLYMQGLEQYSYIFNQYNSDFLESLSGNRYFKIIRFCNQKQLEIYNMYTEIPPIVMIDIRTNFINISKLYMFPDLKQIISSNMCRQIKEKLEAKLNDQFDLEKYYHLPCYNSKHKCFECIYHLKYQDIKKLCIEKSKINLFTGYYVHPSIAMFILMNNIEIMVNFSEIFWGIKSLQTNIQDMTDEKISSKIIENINEQNDLLESNASETNIKDYIISVNQYKERYSENKVSKEKPILKEKHIQQTVFVYKIIDKTIEIPTVKLQFEIAPYFDKDKLLKKINDKIIIKCYDFVYGIQRDYQKIFCENYESNVDIWLEDEFIFTSELDKFKVYLDKDISKYMKV